MRDPKDTVLKLLETNPACIKAAVKTTAGQSCQFGFMADEGKLVLSQAVVMRPIESTERVRS
jgi:hypothetical protein